MENLDLSIFEKVPEPNLEVILEIECNTESVTEKGLV